MSLPCCPTRSPRRVWLGHLSQAEQHSVPLHRSLRSDSPSDNIAACLTSAANTGSGLTGGRSVAHPSSTGLLGQRGTSHAKIPRNGRNTHIAPKRRQPATNASTHTLWQQIKGGGEGGKTTILSWMKIFPGCHGTVNRRPNHTFHHQSHKDGNC